MPEQARLAQMKKEDVTTNQREQFHARACAWKRSGPSKRPLLRRLFDLPESEVSVIPNCLELRLSAY